MDPSALVIFAEHWSGEPGHLHAEGAVVAELGPDRITAKSADFDAAARVLVVHSGHWDRAGMGTLWFSELTVHWEDGWTGEASDAAFRGTLGDRTLRLEGERLAWLADGTLDGDGVDVAPCDCANPPLSVRVRRLWVEPSKKASFRGGWIQVLGVPLVPVPAGDIPLARRSGLMPPVVGYGEDGFRASQPVYLTLGPGADLTVAPEIRTERSIRGLAELRYALRGGTGTLSGSGGTDWLTDSSRGAAEWSHRGSRGLTGAAVQAQILGDPLYLQDYADVYLARTSPWIESRAWGGVGPVELWGSAFQLDDRATDRASASARWPTRLPGGATAELEAAGLAGERVGQGAGAVRLIRETWLGPLRLRPALSGGLSGVPLAWGAAALDVGLPAWRQAQGGRESLEPGVRVLGGLGELDPVAAVPIGGDPIPAWSVEPSFRWSHAGKGSAELLVVGTFRDDGPRASLTSGWAGRRFRGWTQIEAGPGLVVPDLAGGGANAMLGPVDLGAAAIWTARLDDPLASASPTAGWVLPGRLSSVRIAASSLFDVVEPAWQSGTALLRWTHPARCLALEGQVRVDRDEAPTFRMMLDVDP